MHGKAIYQLKINYKKETFNQCNLFSQRITGSFEKTTPSYSWRPKRFTEKTSDRMDLVREI